MLLNVATGVCLFLVFLYMVMLASIVPSQQLISAIAMEVSWVTFILGYRFFRERSTTGRAEKVILDEIINSNALASKARRLFHQGTNVIIVVSLAILCLDFSAFGSAYARNYNLSKTLYLVSPLSYLPFLHPALSLEMLAGAFIEKNDFEAAVPFFQEVMDIRRGLFNEHHELIAAVYADMGELEFKRKRFSSAEEWFRKSIQSNYGKGRAHERLGNCLREEGNFGEAQKFYEEALRVRTHFYGLGSDKYVQTAREYSILLRRMKQSQTADKYDQIELKSSKVEPVSWVVSLIFLVLSIIIAKILYGPDGILTRIVLDKLRRKLERDDSPLILESIRLLESYSAKKPRNLVEKDLQILAPICVLSLARDSI